MWKFLRIDLENVTSTVEQSSFDNDVLENLATLIIEMGGIARSITLKKIGFERYEVITGHLEYYASRIANTRDPRIETINAIVIDADGVDNANRQLELTQPTTITPLTPAPESAIISRLNYLENCLEKYFGEVRESQEKRKTEIQDLSQKLEKLIPPSPKPNIVEVLNTFSKDQLKSLGLGEKMIANIIDERSEKPFDSLDDMRNRPKIKKGLRIDIMAKFLDSYERLELQLGWKLPNS